MSEQPRHEMILGITHPSGAEEWYCPTCGRRFTIQWPPEYKKIILNAGDELAIHTGGKGGVNTSQLHIGQPHEPELPPQIRSSIEKILRDFDGEPDERGAKPDS